MVHTMKAAMDLISFSASLLALILLLRYKKILRSRLASMWVLVGLAFLTALLLTHCFLDFIDVEVVWLDSFTHLLWSMGFLAGIVLAIRFGMLLQGFFSLSIPSYQNIVKRLSVMYSPSACKAILYSAGKEAGFNDSIALMKTMGLRDEAFVRRMIAICEALGWGKYKVISLKLGEEIAIRVYNCFETAGFKKTEGPVYSCICFQSGYWAGVAKALRPEMECEATENMCPLKGDDYCEFVIRFSKVPERD